MKSRKVSRCNIGWSKLVAGGSLLGVLVIYVILAIHLSRHHTFWSPDCGARFWMIRHWVEGGSLLYLPYRAHFLDTQGVIHPLSAGYPGYIVRLARGLATIYPPFFPFVCGVAYRALGFMGLIVVPVISGVGTVTLTTLSARRLELHSWALVPWVMGLTTPLVLYSVTFWDHATQMFLCALAVFLLLKALRMNSPSVAFAAGAALGLGVWLHEFFFLLFLCMLTAGWLGSKESLTRSLIVPFSAGFLCLVLGWLALNQHLYGIPWGTHGMGSNSLAQPAVARRVLNLPWMARQALWQLEGVDPRAELALYCLIPALLVGLGVLRSSWWLVWTYVVAAGGSILLLQGGIWAGGLFQATPILIPALGAPWFTAFPQADASRATSLTFITWMSRAVVLFSACVLVFPLGGGLVNWGNRAMLTGLPILVLLVVWVLEDRVRAAVSRRISGCLLIATVLLVGVSGWSQFRGFQEIDKKLAWDARNVRQLESIDAPVIVTDDWPLWPHSADARLTAECFVVRDNDRDRAVFLNVMHAWQVRKFAYWGRGDLADKLRVQAGRRGMRLRFSDTNDERVFTFEAVPPPTNSKSVRKTPSPSGGED